jgi:hypothetical protein
VQQGCDRVADSLLQAMIEDDAGLCRIQGAEKESVESWQFLRAAVVIGVHEGWQANEASRQSNKGQKRYGELAGVVLAGLAGA